MRTIGKYEIRGRLGRGGMAVVYKARQPVTGRIVALKAMQPGEMVAELMGLDTLTADFWAEARAMARVRHPHVAQILDIGQAGPGDCCAEGTPFFVMEYFCNNLGVLIHEDFDEEGESRRLSTDQALSLTGQLLSALARLHYDGLVHRDVKPFNLMLTDEDQIRLIDFGLSRLRGEEAPAEPGQVKQRPKGLVAGSPFYSAPEQEADPDLHDPRSDLFAVGVTLFRLLTGRLPVAKRVASSLNPELDPMFDGFLDQAMAHDPSKRFQTARDMLAALDELREYWESHKAEVCGLEPEPGPANGGGGPLRSEPRRVGLKQARDVFHLDDLWRPRVYGGANLEPESAPDGINDVVLDTGRSLAWQRTGSEYPLTRPEADRYLARLNQQGFAGRTGWRLPTVDELTSLLDGPHRPGDFCLEPLLAADRPRLWSADAKAFTAAWYVDADLGFVWWQDLTCALWVRAVCNNERE